MTNRKPFSWKERLRSFRYAFAGIARLFRNEHNARIHGVVAVLVIVAGWMFDISTTEWVVIILLIGLVLMAEAFNSAIEALADVVSPQKNEGIKHTKDLAAAAVLLLVIAAVIIGLIIFVPKIITLL